jgi:hypothetical protein
MSSVVTAIGDFDMDSFKTKLEARRASKEEQRGEPGVNFDRTVNVVQGRIVELC